MIVSGAMDQSLQSNAVAGLTPSLITSPTAAAAAAAGASNVNNQTASSLFAQIPANEVCTTSCTKF